MTNATPRKRNKEKGKGDQSGKYKMPHTLTRPYSGAREIITISFTNAVKCKYRSRFGNSWLTEEQSATNEYQQWFQLDIINWALVVIFINSNNLQLWLRADNYKIPAHRQPYR